MDIYAQIINRIIREQESVIGPIALVQAQKVAGISAQSDENVKVAGNGKEILEHLVAQYQKFFGKASIEVCKEALDPIRDKLTSTEIPDILKN